MVAADVLRRYRPLILMAGVQLFLTADQPILSVNMSAAAQEYGLNDVERDERLGGTVSCAFFGAGALLSLAVGYLSDHMSRCRLITGLAFTGGIAILACGTANTYEYLLACRIIVGAVVGGVAPVIYASVGDFYDAAERPQAITMLSIIAGIGPGLGHACAGFIGPNAGWRTPYVVVGSASVGFALMFATLMVETSVKAVNTALPQQSTRDNGAPRLGSIRLLVAIPSATLVFLQGLSGCVPWAIINTFLTDYFAVDLGLGVAGATALFFSFGFGCTVGTIFGGQLGQHLYEKDKRCQPAYMCFAVASGALLLLALFATTARSADCYWSMHLLAMLSGSQAAASGNNAKAILLNTIAPHLRGTAFGVLRFMDDIGKAFGPIVISALVSPFGRKNALMMGISCWFLCALFCGLLCFTVQADEERLRAVLFESSKSVSHAVSSTTHASSRT